MEENLSTKKVRAKKENNDEKETKEMYRVVISNEANKELEVVLKTVNEGFEAGTITKSDIANFVFQNLNKYFSESDIKTLRTQHFDDKKVLSNILRNENELPEELKRAIRSHFGIHDKEKKKTLRNTPQHLEVKENSLETI